MSGTRFILIRHGETAWNLEGRYQGHFDSPLTSAGLAQAEALATRLARAQFDVLYSSDLGRAAQTAQIIARAANCAVRLDARLRERRLGIFQGLTRAVAKQKYPDEFRQFKSDASEFAPPGGESLVQHRDRIVACMADFALCHAGQSVVVITHGGTVSVFLRHVLGLALDAPRRFSRRNAGWNEFTWDGGKWLLDTWGDVNHLED